MGLDGKRVATGRDFASTGELKSPARSCTSTRRRAGALAGRLGNVPFTVRRVERKPYTRSPYAPFSTTTLQQEASRKLGFGAKRDHAGRAEAVRERLHHLHAYRLHLRCRETAHHRRPRAGRAALRRRLRAGRAAHVRDEVKNAQEAHEAIRPAGDDVHDAGPDGPVRRRVPALRADLEAHRRLADEGRHRPVGVDPASAAPRPPGEDAEFAASGKVITFHGFLRAYVEGADDPDAELDDRESPAAAGGRGRPRSPSPRSRPSRTRPAPPARYTEASLVAELEERDIGRPSTYASIIGTILDRGYVFKKGTALVPAWLAFAVVGLLEQHFPHLVDYEFTARMEDVLDDIANGEAQMVDWLSRFYFGTARHGGRRQRDVECRVLGGSEEAGLRAHRRHRRPAGQLGTDRRRDRRARRQVRPVPRARGRWRRRARQRPRGPAAGRADSGEGRGTDRRAVRRPRPRHQPEHGVDRRRAQRSLRPVRDRGAAGGRQGEAAHRVAVPLDGPRVDHHRRRHAAADPAPDPR